eukprot:5381044-Prymnesium_polylepis.1
MRAPDHRAERPRITTGTVQRAVEHAPRVFPCESPCVHLNVHPPIPVTGVSAKCLRGHPRPHHENTSLTYIQTVVSHHP